MERATIINALLELDECPYEREELEEMEADRLAFVANSTDLDFSEIDGEEVATAGGGDVQNADGDDDEPQDDGEEPPAWAQNLMDRLDDLEEDVQPVREEREERAENLRTRIVRNSSLEEEDLEGSPIALLEKLEGELEAAPVDFSGLGGARRSTGARAASGGDGDSELGFAVQSVLTGARGEAAVDGDES